MPSRREPDAPHRLRQLRQIHPDGGRACASARCGCGELGCSGLCVGRLPAVGDGAGDEKAGESSVPKAAAGPRRAPASGGSYARDSARLKPTVRRSVPRRHDDDPRRARNRSQCRRRRIVAATQRPTCRAERRLPHGDSTAARRSRRRRPRLNRRHGGPSVVAACLHGRHDGCLRHRAP